MKGKGKEQLPGWLARDVQLAQKRNCVRCRQPGFGAYEISIRFTSSEDTYELSEEVVVCSTCLVSLQSYITNAMTFHGSSVSGRAEAWVDAVRKAVQAEELERGKEYVRKRLAQLKAERQKKRAEMKSGADMGAGSRKRVAERQLQKR